MKSFLISLKKDRIIFNQFLVSFLILILSLIIILIDYKNLPPLLPIFNQMPWGTDRITQTWGIFIPLGLYLIIFIFNITLSAILYKKGNPLLGRIISAVTLLIAVMNMIFIIRTLLLI